jgi:hypothetical protein
VAKRFGPARENYDGSVALAGVENPADGDGVRLEVEDAPELAEQTEA